MKIMTVEQHAALARRQAEITALVKRRAELIDATGPTAVPTLEGVAAVLEIESVIDPRLVALGLDPKRVARGQIVR